MNTAYTDPNADITYQMSASVPFLLQPRHEEIERAESSGLITHDRALLLHALLRMGGGSEET